VTRGLVQFYVVLVVLAIGMLVTVATYVLVSRGDVVTERSVGPGGSAAMGEALIDKYGCGSCHRIPGVAGAVGRVGPDLGNLADRSYLAGNLPNTPQNLMAWIQDPQGIEPGTAMPNLGVTTEDARDIATFLHALE
jgi:cytochrome c